MNSERTLSDRFFWPAIGLVVAVLCGFGTVVYKTINKPRASFEVTPIAAASAPLVNEFAVLVKEVVLTPEQTAAMDALRAEADQEKTDAAVVQITVEAAAPKPEMEEESPYVVPANKPFITREAFEQQAAKMEAARKAAAKLKPKPPAVKPAPSAPVPVPGKTPAIPPAPGKSAAPALLGVARPSVYVTRDGRKISVAKAVDLGDSYGLKTATGQILTIQKDEITQIIKP